MGQIIDLTGHTYGRWTVLGFSHQVGKARYWHCVCQCGTGRAVFAGDLRRAGSRSCGCLGREERAEWATTHGMAGHPAYKQWVGMRSRCTDKAKAMYYLYGGRGITVCKRWDDFARFWQDMGPTWQPGLTLDRIDSDGNYTPRNCRWATAAEQAANRRTNHIISTPDGPMMVTDAARKYGISPFTLFARIRYGWDERDLLTPVRKSSRVYPKRASMEEP